MRVRLETGLLADVTDDFYFAAACRQCEHGKRLKLSALRVRLGGEYPLVKIRERLRCKKCGSREIVITFLAPDQKTGSLVQLFDRKAGE